MTPANTENRTDRPRRATTFTWIEDGEPTETLIRTKHGTLRIGPRGELDGLWKIVRAELRTNEEVRRLCKIKTRKTLLDWRANHGFPKPVLEIPAKGGVLELWERTAVEAWLEDHRTKGTQ
jgi:hypothetical protein